VLDYMLMWMSVTFTKSREAERDTRMDLPGAFDNEKELGTSGSSTRVSGYMCLGDPL